jgi:hypothetical protein
MSLAPSRPSSCHFGRAAEHLFDFRIENKVIFTSKKSARRVARKRNKKQVQTANNF